MKKLKRRKKKLTPKQQKLCENFVKLDNKEEAYIASGYKGNGNHQAYVRALFDKPEIIEHIETLRNEYQPELEDLSIKHQLFVKEYLKDFNASRAYKAVVKPEAKGSSLYAAASWLLHEEKIQRAIKVEVDARFERLDIEGDILVRLLMNIADNDPAELFDVNQNLNSIKDKGAKDV